MTTFNKSLDAGEHRFDKDFFRSLPSSILEKSFEYLDFKDLAGLSCINHFTKCSSADSRLWANLCHQRSFKLEKATSAKISFRNTVLIAQQQVKEQIRAENAKWSTDYFVGENGHWGMADVLS